MFGMLDVYLHFIYDLALLPWHELCALNAPKVLVNIFKKAYCFIFSEIFLVGPVYSHFHFFLLFLMHFNKLCSRS